MRHVNDAGTQVLTVGVLQDLDIVVFIEIQVFDVQNPAVERI